jgi:hypothetical protein
MRSAVSSSGDCIEPRMSSAAAVWGSASSRRRCRSRYLASAWSSRGSGSTVVRLPIRAGCAPQQPDARLVAMGILWRLFAPKPVKKVRRTVRRARRQDRGPRQPRAPRRPHQRPRTRPGTPEDAPRPRPARKRHPEPPCQRRSPDAKRQSATRPADRRSAPQPHHRPQAPSPAPRTRTTPLPHHRPPARRRRPGTHLTRVAQGIAAIPPPPQLSCWKKARKSSRRSAAEDASDRNSEIWAVRATAWA